MTDAPAPWQEQYAKPGWQDMLTKLSPEQESQFQGWAKQNGAPITSDYDMRGFWLGGGQGTAVNSNDKRLHYPDTYKTPLHQSFSAESNFADQSKSPPRWNDKDQLVATDGAVLFDERKKGHPTFEDTFGPAPVPANDGTFEGAFGPPPKPSTLYGRVAQLYGAITPLSGAVTGVKEGLGAINTPLKDLAPETVDFLEKAQLMRPIGDRWQDHVDAFKDGLSWQSILKLPVQILDEGAKDVSSMALGSMLAAGVGVGKAAGAAATGLGGFAGGVKALGADTELGKQTAIQQGIEAGGGIFESTMGHAGIHGQMHLRGVAKETQGTVLTDVGNRLGENLAEARQALTEQQRAATLPEAHDLGVIGGAEGQPQESASGRSFIEEARAEAAAAKAEPAPEVAPAEAPDVHALARQIDPDTMGQYDALQARQDTYRRLLEELNQQRQAPIQEQIDAILGKVNGVEERLTKTKAAALADLRDQLANGGDSPDMARVRKALMDNDYRLRDIAPDVSKAVREAESRMPAEVEPIAEPVAEPVAEAAAEAPVAAETPAAEVPQEAPAAAEAPVTVTKPAETPEPVRAVTTPAHLEAIAADVSKQLTSAGRPAEEASAAAQLVAAHYEARAARFGGQKGTALDLYDAEGPEIKAGTVGRAMVTAFAQQMTRGKISFRNAITTITLFKDANASTFLHETGHQWLDEMMRDAQDGLAPEGLKADAKTVRDWLGVKEGEKIARAQHEKFARGFERYLMEGRAPSKGLAAVFDKFRTWLTQIYQTVTKLRSPITDDIRDVFDRLIVENPQRQPLAERPGPAKMLADIHAADAEHTPPQHAETAGDQVEPEIVETAKTGPHTEEVANVEGGRRPGEGAADATGLRRSGAEPGGADAGREGGAAPSPTLGGGPGNAAAEGPQPRPAKRSVYESVPRQPERLASFLKRHGGLVDDGGDVRHALGDVRSRPGLINGNGMSLDEAAHLAWENGYFPEHGEVRPTPNDLLAALGEDLRGNSRYSAHDMAAVEDYEGAKSRNAEIDRLAQEHGIDTKGLTREEFFGKIAEKLSEQDLDRTIKEQDEAFAAALREAEEKAEQTRGDAWEPVNEEVPARTLEELENERRQEEASRGAIESTPSAGTPESGGAGGSQEGAEPRGSGAGIAGRPGEEISEPVRTPDIALEPHPELIDKAGNIRLDKLSTDRDVAMAIHTVADRMNGFTAERRGKVADAKVMELADTAGVSLDEVNLDSFGKMMLPEKVEATRRLLVESAQDLIAKAKAASDAIDAGADPQAAMGAFQSAWDRHALIQGHLSSVSAEWGRIGRVLNRMVPGQDAVAALKEIGKEGETPETYFQAQWLAKMMAALDSPDQVGRLLRDAQKPNWKDFVVEYYIHNLISGPITHTKYAIHNNLLLLARPVETALAAAVGKAHALVNPEIERVHLGEAKASLQGYWNGLLPGLNAALKAVKANALPALPGETSADLFSQGQGFLMPKTGVIPGTAGEVFRAPARFIQGIHAFTRVVGYSQEAYAMAYRLAANAGLEGQALARRMAETLANPDADFMTHCRDEAMKMSLMERAKYDSVTAMLNRITKKSLVAKLVQPFINVQANILKQSYLERTPVGLASAEIRGKVMGAEGTIAQQQQIGKMMLGASIATGVAVGVGQGVITGGGPADAKERAIWLAAGNQPYSIRVGDTWVSFRGGPIGTIMGAVADAAEILHDASEEDAAEIAKAVVAGMGKNVLDESNLRGFHDAIDAALNPRTSGPRYLRNMAANFIPWSVGLGQITRAIDPDIRHVETLVEAAKSRVPFVSQTLTPSRDVFGEPIRRASALPGIYATSQDNPMAKEMLELGVFPARLPKDIDGVDLDEHQSDAFQRIAGRGFALRMQGLLALPGWEEVPPQMRAEVISKALSDSRRLARMQMKIEYPEIVRQAAAQRIDDIKARFAR